VPYCTQILLDDVYDNRKDGLVRLLMLEKQVDQKTNAWCVMNNTPVDETIYTKNRQFRLVGNGKRGRWPLTIVESANDVSCMILVSVCHMMLCHDMLCYFIKC